MALRTNVERIKKRKDRGTVAGVSLLAGAMIISALILKRPNISPVVALPPPIVGEFDTVSVAVPTEPVAVGTRGRDIKFKKISFPRHQVPPGALTDLLPVLDMVTVAALPADLPLFKDNFTTEGSHSNPVIERIPPGMRAITVKVDATSAVEGWAGSGSIVDVLLVEKDRTTVVAEKVRVLSAERKVSPVEGAASPNVPSTITLLVTQEQCLAINTAIPRGKIAFALRSTHDEENWGETIYTAERLKGGSIISDTKGVITGYAAVGGVGSARAFALTNNRWIKTESVPEGFLVGQE